MGIVLVACKNPPPLETLHRELLGSYVGPIGLAHVAAVHGTPTCSRGVPSPLFILQVAAKISSHHHDQPLESGQVIENLVPEDDPYWDPVETEQHIGHAQVMRSFAALAMSCYQSKQHISGISGQRSRRCLKGENLETLPRAFWDPKQGV